MRLTLWRDSFPIAVARIGEKRTIRATVQKAKPGALKKIVTAAGTMTYINSSCRRRAESSPNSRNFEHL
jgi:hypothetical protein